MMAKKSVKESRERDEQLAILYAGMKASIDSLVEAEMSLRKVVGDAASLPGTVRSGITSAEESLLNARSAGKKVSDLISSGLRTYGYLDHLGELEFDELSDTLDPHLDTLHRRRRQSFIEVSDDEFMDSIKAYIDENLTNPDLTVSSLADSLCISRSGLFSKVKSISGDTPNNMIVEARLQKALGLLNEGKLSVNEIAYMVGFASPSYFSRCFDKRFGQSPYKWLKDKQSS